MRGVDHALRQEFGDDLVNEEWQIKDVDGHTELKIKNISGLAFNRYLYKALQLEQFTRPGYEETSPVYGSLDDDFPNPTGQFDDANYVFFGWDASFNASDIPDQKDYANYRMQNNLNDIVHWFIAEKEGTSGGTSFQTMYIYSDVVETQIVGDVRANVLRVVAPRGEPNEIVHENFPNLFYNPVRLNRIKTIEVLLRGDTGEPISFKGGVVTLTLMFVRNENEWG